jgi:hypothetical protein
VAVALEPALLDADPGIDGQRSVGFVKVAGL